MDNDPPNDEHIEAHIQAFQRRLRRAARDVIRTARRIDPEMEALLLINGAPDELVESLKEIAGFKADSLSDDQYEKALQAAYALEHYGIPLAS
jgi:hypothetical protein